jgi:Domain of unknown function (DUF4157)
MATSLKSAGKSSNAVPVSHTGLTSRLKVNEPGDAYEQEADQVADQVMTARARPAVSSTPPRVQRFSGQSNAQEAAPASVDQALANPGRPLEPTLRQDMEQRFGHDFSRVRVHTGGAADQSARDVNARAYSVGHNMVFGAGGFAPGTHSGRRLLAHELTHVVQQEHVGTSSVLHRKPATKPQASEAKQQVIEIEAVMDSKKGTGTLSDGKTVPLTLAENTFPPGTRVLNHEGNGKYTSIPDPNVKAAGGFVWINPYLPGTKEISYNWAPQVTVKITLTAEQRIARLPEHIRTALTTNQGELAGADEIEEIARAGEMLAQAGVSAQDMILYQEQIKAVQAGGVHVAEVGASDFASWLVGRRANQQQQSADRLDDIVTISKILGNEPLYMLRSPGLSTALDADNDRGELVVGIGVYRAYKDQGRAQDVSKLDVAGQRKYFHQLAVGFRTLLLRFEQALLADLRGLANIALDAAEGSILLMDKRFTGIWQEVVPGPGWLNDEIDRINQSEPIVRATDARIEATAVIDRETIIDKRKLHEGPAIFAPTLQQSIEYMQREAARDERRKKAEADFEDAVRTNTQLKLPPGKSARELLEAKDPHTRVRLLGDFLYDGRRKIRAARTEIKRDKVLYAADIWVKAEQDRLKGALGAQLGGDIAELIDGFAKLRKSQTSIWEDILHILEFVSMFVPGPIGWGLRAGTAIIGAHMDLSQQYTQGALYGSGGSKVQASSGTFTVVNAIVNMIPDASVVAKGAGAGERLTTRGLERAGAGATDDAARLAGQAVDDAAKTGGHAVTEGTETTLKNEGRTAVSGAEHTQTVPHGETPKPGAVERDETFMRIRGEDEPQTVTIGELRDRRDALARDKAKLQSEATGKQAEIDRLRENVDARKAEMKEPRRLQGEDKIDELETELAKKRKEISDVDRNLSEAQGDLSKLEGPKPPAPAPVPTAPPRPPQPIGELAIPAQPVTLHGTRMDSWSDRVYIGTSTSGYRENVEKLLLKDPEGPLSKALLLDNQGAKTIRPWNSPTKEVAEANRDLFVAGHFKSNKFADRDVIVLTSAHRNMEFAANLEIAGAGQATGRMGDFVYVVQGIAVEPGTAWDLVRSTSLDAAVRSRLAQELTEANKLWLAR